LTSIALAWLAGVVLLGVVGYLGSERFAVAPACLLCPVIGAGAARALQPFEGRWRLAAAAVLVLLVVPLALRQWERTEARFDDLPVAESDALADLIEQSGGRDALVACPGPVRIEDSRLLARLVYELQAPAGQADTMLFVAEPPAGGPQVILARHGGVTEYELDRTAAIGLAEVVALTANDYWSAYAVACERTGNRLPH
jgi:hypothetical protein